MKIAVCSDLHLEFMDLTLENPGDVEVLILSGDICVAADLRTHDPLGILDGTRSDRYHKFFRNCAANFRHVVYVAGNHEHYHGDFPFTVGTLKFFLSDIPNLYVLDKETVKIGDTYFVGGTMWTDMNKEDPLTLYHIKSMMNDFRIVKNSNNMVTFKTFEPINKEVGMTDEEYLALPHEKRFKTVFKEREAKFSPEDAVADNKEFRQYLQSVIEGKGDEKFVVCTHHTPSHRSCHPRYSHDQTMNGGYHNHLDDYIEDHPQIKLWTHGHTHERYDYMIGDTRIICNPRGYKGYEDIAETFELKIVEV